MTDGLGYVLTYSPPVPPPPSPTPGSPAPTFIGLPGSATNIADGASGSAWVVGTTAVPGGHGIYHWTGHAWAPVPGGAVAVAVGPDASPWVVNSAHQIFHRTASGWLRYPGAATDIAVGANGSVWVVGTNAVPGGHGIYHWTGQRWARSRRAAPSPSRLARTASPWVVNSRTRSSTGRRPAGPLPGAATDIAVGANGSVWVVGTNAVPGGHGIYHWTGRAWAAVPGGAVTIAVDPHGNPWVTNAADKIYAA